MLSIELPTLTYYKEGDGEEEKCHKLSRNYKQRSLNF